MWICTMAVSGLLAASGIFSSSGEAEEPGIEVSIRDCDQQIVMLKQEIAKYTSYANQFDRKATQLRSRDFSGYRNACELRDHCREIASDLQKHLEMLEKQETELIQSQKKAEMK